MNGPPLEGGARVYRVVGFRPWSDFATLFVMPRIEAMSDFVARVKARNPMVEVSGL